MNRCRLKIILCGLLATILLLVVLDAAYVVTVGLIHVNCPPAEDIMVLGSGHGVSATQRALTGLDIYRRGKSAHLVLTGGTADFPTSEAEFMESVIVRAANVATSSLPFILEQQSRSTYENFLFSHRIIPNTHSIIIVSDTFHIARSLLIATTLGYHVVCWASPNPSYLNPLVLTQYYLREMAAVPVYIAQYVVSLI
jgi:uncharacterized SAM-binding protein YcdF (DUF218 family)